MNVKRMWTFLATLFALVLLAVAMLSAGIAERANDVESVPETETAEVILAETEVTEVVSTEVTEETSEPAEETLVEEVTDDALAVVVEETTKPTEAIQEIEAELTEETEENLLTEAEPTEEIAETEPEPTEWQGEVLTARNGTVQGPSGKETWYDLKMSGVVKIMRKLGYSESEYPYYVREDGCKMLGSYIMCAANLDIRPRGTILQTSLGEAIVCDTGGFAKKNKTQIDIAVDWLH